MLVSQARMVEIECVARGYLAGSGWKEYRQTGAVCGVTLPPGLQESSQLPEPIFTPATKAQSGHDENISFDTMSGLAGADLAITALAGIWTLRIYGTRRGVRTQPRHHHRRHEIRIRNGRGRAHPG